MRTPGVAQGSENTFCFLNRNCTSVKNGTSGIKTKNYPKLKYTPFVSSFFMMPGTNQVKVSTIMEYFNNCSLNYYIYLWSLFSVQVFWSLSQVKANLFSE